MELLRLPSAPSPLYLSCAVGSVARPRRYAALGRDANVCVGLRKSERHCRITISQLVAATTAAVATVKAAASCRRCRSRVTVQRHAMSPGRRSAMAMLTSATIASAAPQEDAGAIAGGVLEMRQGMEAFTKGDVARSVQLFDKAAAEGYPKAYLWQRGLSLYYLDKFEEGSQQFRKDVELNPNDTEESIWALLCDAQRFGLQEARARMLEVGRDPRDVMRTVYSLFRGEKESESIAFLEKTATAGKGSGFFERGADEFYAALYLGLFAEAKGDASEAKRWIAKAVSTPYSKNSGDYMTDLARVHIKVRGWDSKTATEL